MPRGGPRHWLWVLNSYIISFERLGGAAIMAIDDSFESSIHMALEAPGGDRSDPMVV